MSDLRLGYEIGSGERVDIPLGHMAVTGQTQASGKTTTLEALALRSGARCLAFVTKRGERAFGLGRQVQPYFRDRADWQFVDQLLSATLQEKNKFLRSWIIKLCRDTETLADVLRAVRREKKAARRSSLNEGVYTQLEAYLELIVPEIERADLASALHLRAGLNVMDVSEFATPMQMLFVQSAIDQVNAHEEQTIVIVPEAWEFIPEGKGSPVKASAVDLVRKGAALGNYIWVDSQDMAGVDKVILRGCAVWLIGVQREANEIKRNLANIPKGITRPDAAAVAHLERGQFYACWGKHAVRTYVEPSWLDENGAREIALGAPLPVRVNPFRRQETTVTEKEARELREANERLQRENDELRRTLERLESRLESSAEPAHAMASTAGGISPDRVVSVASVDTHPTNGAPPTLNLDVIYADFKQRLIADAPGVLRVLTSKPELRVEVERHVVTADGRSLRGRIARLIAEGFFEKAQTSANVLDELLKRGADRPSNIELGNEMKALCEMGFFTRENKWYSLVPGSKVNVVER